MPRRTLDLGRYSQQQVQAARLLCDPESSHTKADIAKTVGITTNTLYRWCRDPEFIELVNHINETIMDMFAVDVYRALRRKVEKGDTKAIELAMKRMGVLIDRKEIQSDVRVEHEVLAGKTNDQLRAELEAAEKKLLGDVIDTVEVEPDTFDVVDDGDGMVDADVGDAG